MFNTPIYNEEDDNKYVSEKKEQIIKIYADLAQLYRRVIHLNDMIDAGITKDMITHHFQSLGRLSEVARETYPDHFYDTPIEDLINSESTDVLKDIVSTYNKFVIVTAVTGCQVDESLLDSIKHYCALNDAALLVLVSSDPAHNKEFGRKYGSIDKRIIEAGGIVVSQDIALNNNIFLSTIKLSAKQIDPITSLNRIGQRHGSFIYASPKQRLKPVAVSNEKLPHFLMTTGAITSSNYTTENYMSERTAYIADHDHIMGGLVVEVVDDEMYHFRQFQGDVDGSFIDLGIKYTKDTVGRVIPAAFVLGDWHSGETDPRAARCWCEIIDELKVKKIVLHDAFNGSAINHHEQDQNIERAKKAELNQLDLSAELRGLAFDLDYLSSIVDEVIVVKSNHDMFLERYLQSGRYVSDPHNHKISLQLAIQMLDGVDPLRYGVENSGLNNKDKIKWLQIDEDYKIAGIQLGAHGDRGANGSRGSLRSIEAAYGNSVTGHSHSPEILRGAWQCGTSSFLKLSYVKGPSSWLHTSCIVYENGSRQLINVINGEWCL